MPHQTTGPTHDWLSLHEASAKLGVSAATLRNWGNEGKIKSSRTPGGHRRFSSADIHALMGARPDTPNLARVRMSIRKDELEEMEWYRGFDEKTKVFYRDLGGRLMTLLMRVIRGEGDERELHTEANALGTALGQGSIRANIPLADTLRMFLFFRDYVLEDVIALIPALPQADQNAVKRYRRASGFFNEVLIALAKEF